MHHNSRVSPKTLCYEKFIELKQKIFKKFRKFWEKKLCPENFRRMFNATRYQWVKKKEKKKNTKKPDVLMHLWCIKKRKMNVNEFRKKTKCETAEAKKLCVEYRTLINVFHLLKSHEYLRACNKTYIYTYNILYFLQIKSFSLLTSFRPKLFYHRTKTREREGKTLT